MAKTKILLVCSAGTSTSLLVTKMEQAAFTMKLDVEVAAMASEAAKQQLEKWDVIMLGPQVSFMKSSFTAITKKPLDVIPPNIYALGKGKEAIELAQKLLAAHK